MKKLIILLLYACAGYGQTLHGLGFSSKTCVDLDGDGYGTGPLAALVTTLSTAVVSTGSQTVTLASAAGLQAGQRIRVDSSTNLEFVILTAVSGSTVTGYFNGLHSSGVTVSAGTTGSTIDFPGYPHDDPGCLGLDADDRDSTVHLGSDAVSKYTINGRTAAQALVAFLSKLGVDLQVQEWDIASNAAFSTPPPCSGNPANCSAGAVLYNTARTYYLAPATPTATCLANASSSLGNVTAQCTGVSHSGGNSCVVITQPCLTISPDLTGAGWNNSGVGGDLIIYRDGWDGRITTFSGVAARYNAHFAYPGEHPVLDGTVNSGFQMILAQTNCNTPDGANFILVDGFRFQNGNGLGGGTIDPLQCPTQMTSDNHDIWVQHVEGTEGGSQGLATISAFNGMNNWVITYSALHDNGFMHGIYVGAHGIQSTASTVRRNLLFRNSWNGSHINGQDIGWYVDQNVSYDNGITGLDFEEGFSNGFIRSNTIFNNAKGLSFFNYNPNNPASNDAHCPTQANFVMGLYTQYTLCPVDQTGNLIENNTIWQTGNANNPAPGSSPDSGCPAMTAPYCSQNAVEISNAASPIAGNLGGNIWRNNVLASYGHGSLKASISYGDPVAGGTCGTTCQTWPPQDVYDHDLFWATDGLSSSGSALILNLGPSNYTLSTASGVTMTFTSNAFSNPGFVAEANGFWNNESAFTFIPLPSGSSVLHAGSLTGIPNYDLNGRAFTEDGPSIGAIERNLFVNGWNAIGAGWSTAVSAPNGTPLDTLAAAVTSNSQTTLSVTGGLPAEQPNSLALISDGTHTPELVCIASITGASTPFTVTLGTGCPTGTPSGNGRGWGGTTPQAAINNGATLYNNPMTASGTLATIVANVYPMSTQWPNGNNLGSGMDAFKREVAGKPHCLGMIGGGHSNSLDNSFYCIFFNKATATISRITTPSNHSVAITDQPGSFGSPTVKLNFAQLQDGAPNIGHNQGTTSHASWTDSFYQFGGSFGGSPDHSYPTFTYSFGSAAWSRYVGTSSSTAVTTTATASMGSTSMTVGTLTGLVTGQLLYGCNGCAPGTIISSAASNPITISQATTGAVSGSVTFAPVDTDCAGFGTGHPNCIFGVAGQQIDPIGDLNQTSSGFITSTIADSFTQTLWSYWSVASNFNMVTQFYPLRNQHVGRQYSIATGPVCCGVNAQATSRVFLSDTRKIFYNVLNSTLNNFTYDISGVTSQTPTASPNPSMASVTPNANCNTLLNTNSPGLAFDPVIAKVVGIASTNNGGGGGNTVWLMDPYSGTPFSCSSLTPLGTGFPANPTWAYMGSFWQYSEDLDAFVGVTDSGLTNPHVLSLVQTDPTVQVLPPGSAPATIKGVSGSGISTGIQ